MAERGERLPGAGTAGRGVGSGGIAAGFWLYALHLVTVWAIALSNALLGLVGLWSLRRWRLLRAHGAARSTLAMPLLCYAVFLAVAVLTSRQPAVSAPELKEILSLASLPFALLLVRGEDRARRVVDLVIVMTVALAVWGIGQFVLTDFGPLENRIRGPFSHYMTFSGVMLSGGFLVLARISMVPGRRRLGDWAMLGVVFVALVLTLTRGAWVAAAITGAVAAVAFSRRSVRIPLGAGMVAVLLFLLLAPGPWAERARSIADPRNPSSYDRLCMAEAGIAMIRERPLFGIGPRMVRELYPLYRNPTAPRHTVGHLHNTFIDLAAERGLLSLGAYLWLMTAGVVAAARGWRRGEARDLNLGVLLAVVAFNIAGLFEANWRDTEVQRLVLFLLAVPFAARSRGGDGAAASGPDPSG